MHTATERAEQNKSRGVTLGLSKSKGFFLCLSKNNAQTQSALQLDEFFKSYLINSLS
jgi:hypothetical protein